MTELGWILVIAGLLGEAAAIAVTWGTPRAVERLSTADLAGMADLLKALIAKLPWIAVVSLLNIVLGMVLLMERWPWEPPA
jgi:hypothetical protein